MNKIVRNLIVCLIVSTTTIFAAEQISLLPKEDAPFTFQTDRCIVKLSTWRDYDNLYNLFSGPRARFQFGPEISEDEQREIAASFKTKVALFISSTNWFPCLFGSLMVIQKKEDETFLGTCSVSSLKLPEVHKFLRTDGTYISMGICLNEHAQKQEYGKEIAQALLANIKKYRPYHATGAAVLTNKNHPYLSKPDITKKITESGFVNHGEIFFEHGPIPSVVDKSVTMLLFVKDDLSR